MIYLKALPANNEHHTIQGVLINTKQTEPIPRTLILKTRLDIRLTGNSNNDITTSTTTTTTSTTTTTTTTTLLLLLLRLLLL